MSGEISMTGAAVVALVASSIIGIAFRRLLVTRWERAHAHRMYLAPNNFTNSLNGSHAHITTIYRSRDFLKYSVLYCIISHIVIIKLTMPRRGKRYY